MSSLSESDLHLQDRQTVTHESRQRLRLQEWALSNSCHLFPGLSLLEFPPPYNSGLGCVPDALGDADVDVPVPATPSTSTSTGTIFLSAESCIVSVPLDLTLDGFKFERILREEVFSSSSDEFETFCDSWRNIDSSGGDDDRSTQTSDSNFELENVLLYVGLVLESRKGQESFWWAYLDSLPTAELLHSLLPLYYVFEETETAEESGENGPEPIEDVDVVKAKPEFQEMLGGTNLLSSLVAVRKKLRLLSRKLNSSLSSMGPITWEELLWAYSVVWSRSFPVPVPVVRPLNASSDSSEPSSRMRATMLPLVDSMNHQFRTPIEFVISDETYEIRTRVDMNVGPKQQVFCNYGGKSNDSFLMCYGFVISENPCDSVCVCLGSGMSSEEKAFYLTRESPLPEDLLLEIERRRNGDPGGFVTLGSVLLLLSLLRNQLSRIWTPTPSSANFERYGSKWNVREYVVGQREILNVSIEAGEDRLRVMLSEIPLRNESFGPSREDSWEELPTSSHLSSCVGIRGDGTACVTKPVERGETVLSLDWDRHVISDDGCSELELCAKLCSRAGSDVVLALWDGLLRRCMADFQEGRFFTPVLMPEGLLEAELDPLFSQLFQDIVQVQQEIRRLPTSDTLPLAWVLIDRFGYRFARRRFCVIPFPELRPWSTWFRRGRPHYVIPWFDAGSNSVRFTALSEMNQGDVFCVLDDVSFEHSFLKYGVSVPGYRDEFVLTLNLTRQSEDGDEVVDESPELTVGVRANEPPRQVIHSLVGAVGGDEALAIQFTVAYIQAVIQELQRVEDEENPFCSLKQTARELLVSSLVNLFSKEDEDSV